MKIINRYWYYSFLALGVLILATSSCKKDDSINQITDFDGNVYHAVTIGTQVWMVENLKVTHYRNGDLIPNVTNNSEWNNVTTGAYRDYEDNPDNSIKYGKLYNFFTITDSRQLCPAGWHVPTDDEWRVLREYCGSCGGVLKEAGTENWLSPNTDATNKTGFSALPGGCLNILDQYDGMARYGVWWSSTEIRPYYAACWFLYYNSSFMSSPNGGALEWFGLSVRCVKD